MKARAAVQTAVRRFEMKEFDLPEIGPNDGILRVEQSGICGSDWHQYVHGFEEGEVSTGAVRGHEPVGVIEAVGDESAKRWDVKAGDRVAVEPFLSCRFCRNCVMGRYNQCQRRGIATHRAYGYVDVSVPPHLWGSHAEFMYLAPETILHKVPQDVPAEKIAVFNVLGSGVQWIEMGQIRLGDTVVILGSGQRGLACVIAAREMGASNIIVTGLTADEPKLDVARKLGATETINVEKTDVLARVREITDGGMADIVIDAASGATSTVDQSLDLARPGGNIVMAGFKSGPVPEFDTMKVITKSLTIRGPWGVDFDAYDRSLAIIFSDKYRLELLHTHTLPLEDLERALKILGGEDPEERGIFVSVTPR